MDDQSGSREMGAAARKVCAVCGQDFDLTDLDQVFHHDAEPHERLDAAE